MINGTVVSVRGNVATEPVLRVTDSLTSLCSFRLAVTTRRWSAAERRSVDVDTSFYTVTCWRTLAENAAASLAKGDGVVVVGRLRVREFVHEGQARTTADIAADALGHDLMWGTTQFRRIVRTERVDADQAEAEALADAVAAGGGPGRAVDLATGRMVDLATGEIDDPDTVGAGPDPDEELDDARLRAVELDDPRLLPAA